MDESEGSKCPKCGAQMEKGVIGAWYIFWSTRRKDVFWRSPPRQDLIARPGWTAKNYVANKCTKCQLILFDYGYEAPSQTPKSFLKNCVQCGKEIPIASEECPYCGKKQPKQAKKVKRDLSRRIEPTHLSTEPA